MQTSVIVGLLLIAAVWSVYLLPSVFGDRQNAPKNSTEEFDRWTHLMADVQKRSYNRRAVGQRDVIRNRRRRTMGILIVLAVMTAGLALFRRRPVIFREGEPPLVTLFAMIRAADLPAARDGPWVEPPLVIRCADGSIHPEYSLVKLSIGFPP